MDVERARQIIESDGVIEVLYQGSPVWIEKILDNNQAQVSDIKPIKLMKYLYMLVEKNCIKAGIEMILQRLMGCILFLCLYNAPF